MILFFFYTTGTKSEKSEYLTFVPLKKKNNKSDLSLIGMEKRGFVSNSVMMEKDESHIHIRCSILHFLVLFFDWF